MNYRNILEKGTLILKHNSILTASLDAELLLSISTKRSREKILLNLSQKLKKEEIIKKHLPNFNKENTK